MNKEYLNVILADSDEENQIVFKSIFKDLKIDVRIQNMYNGADLLEYLNNDESLVPEILFMNYDIPGKNSLECLEEIKMDFRFSNMTVAAYSDHLSEEETEGFFIKGGNVFINKPVEYKALKKVLSEVIAISWQYHTSGLNKDNFIMKI